MNQEQALSDRPDIAAAVRGGDPHQGMEEEIEITTSTLDQAVFWTSVYSEILSLEKDVMARIRQLMTTQSPRVRQEVETSNVPVIAAQLARFQRRHDVWQDRVEQLQSPG